ncbi:MAG: PEGA domain-containing protein [Spirochaetaceae bacterium]|nr:PEGA domain-containing protein [Spirochaetaceae bacterium]
MLCAILLTVVLSPLFARAKAEEEEEKPVLNTEWTLALTAFDTSELPPSQAVLGELIVRELVDSLRKVRYHIRSGEELAFYRDYERNRAVKTAASALDAKQKSRDELLFRGERRWKYRKELRAIDSEIVKLEEALRTAETDIPVIEPSPVFVLASETPPPPPAPGGEYAFCRTRKADAFLSGSISEFHGRIYVSVKIYVLYAQRYMYEDFALFSTGDREASLSVLGLSLGSLAAGTGPVQVAVKAEPASASLTVDNSLAGRGGEFVLDLFPGEFSVSAYNSGYEDASALLELEPGEIAELYINLTPLLSKTVEIQSDEEGALVYLGSQYIGRTPLSFEVSPYVSQYVLVENQNGEQARVIFQDYEGAMTVRPLPVEVPESKSVNNLRRKFYGAFGRFWISLSLAVLINGMRNAYTLGYNVSGNPALYNSAINYDLASKISWGAMGFFLAESIVRYVIYTASSERPPVQLVRQ